MTFLKANRIRVFGSDGYIFLMNEVKLIYEATEDMSHEAIKENGSVPLNFLQLI